MRLSQLYLLNFRSCYRTSVRFADHLTLIVGENDAGKSNIIDALRISIPTATGRSTLWFSADRDLSRGAVPKSPIEVQRVYTDLTATEDAFYMAALLEDGRDLVHTTAFDTDPATQRRHRVTNTVTRERVTDPEPENRDRIAHVYLPPLRDAVEALGSASGTRLAEMIRILATELEVEEFVEGGNAALKQLAGTGATKKIRESVQRHLTSVTQPVRHRLVSVNHERQTLSALARSLRLHMAAEGLDPVDLLGSGLGYANLLFIATIVLELERASEFDLMLLLVEEPEAHLHPQLQAVLLSYLEEQAEMSAKQPSETGPAGRIQVIATSHSPNLASSVSTDKLVVARCQNRDLPNAVESESSGGPEQNTAAVAESGSDGAPDGVAGSKTPESTETVAVALADVPLVPTDRRKVDRYLDVTRASLLFARQVILVEGIAEALLLRTIAEKVVFPSADDADTDAGGLNRRHREQFRAISIVPVGGVDFRPYVQLLLCEQGPLVDRLVVITDGDEGGAGQRRKAALEDEFAELATSGCLKVSVGATTLEAELFAALENEDVLRKAFETQHPRSLDKWDALNVTGESPAQRAARFSKALQDKALDLGKGDFAQVVAELINESSTFKVPSYLEAAIHAAVI